MPALAGVDIVDITHLAVAQPLLGWVAAAWTFVWPALAIALLRIGDVTLNVCRTVLIVQERRWLAAMTAGLEAAAWLAAAGIVFADLSAVRTAGYVLGVAAGTAIGVEITRKLRLGMTTVRIYTDATRTDGKGHVIEAGEAVADAIRRAGYAATVFRGRGYRGPVDMVLSTTRRRHAEQVVRIARDVDPVAFAAVDNSPLPAPATTTAGRA